MPRNFLRIIAAFMSLLGIVAGSLFGPMDGLWILWAYFTANKVGSGEATD